MVGCVALSCCFIRLGLSMPCAVERRVLVQRSVIYQLPMHTRVFEVCECATGPGRLDRSIGRLRFFSSYRDLYCAEMYGANRSWYRDRFGCPLDYKLTAL